MSLVRDIPFTVPAMQETLLATCSALVTTGSTGVVTPIADTSADALISAAGETTGFGRVIDRLTFPVAGAKYNACVVSAWINSTRGSTEADRKITVGVRLLHGDSSGGGDLAAYSTANQPATRTFFSTARTTDMLQWDGSLSTGAVYAPSNPGYYDLRGAKRYLQVAALVLKNKITTESSGDEQCRVGATITFLAGDKLPQRQDTTGAYSSTTSTA
jgi:hypothetical protein